MTYKPNPPHITLRRDSLALRLLRAPLIKTTDQSRAVKSWWTWGDRGEYYAMSTLSILHTLTGFYVNIEDDA